MPRLLLVSVTTDLAPLELVLPGTGQRTEAVRGEGLGDGRRRRREALGGGGGGGGGSVGGGVRSQDLDPVGSPQ